ncbi:MAG TPA: peptidoglycan-binding protein [Candidatus Deferrimicrobium sp.]|nr:peptidoglycan-binding protein [Candidatus Deferrimicrobium sp.]
MILKVGATGPAVRHRQHQLKKLGYYMGKLDGVFGQGTRTAVIKFQSANGLTADGIIGPATGAVLDRLAGHRHNGMMGMTLRLGSQGRHVTMMQGRLKMLGYYSGNADGLFGKQTEAAVKAFQSANGLTPDGIVGPKTMMALHSASRM